MMTIYLRSSKYKCPNCRSSDFVTATTQWKCQDCAQAYPAIGGIPKLFVEANIGAQDRKLRDGFYDGVFGRFYQFMMPLIVLPVRPFSMSWPYWAAFALVWLALAALMGICLFSIVAGAWGWAVLSVALAVAVGVFLTRQPYLFYLLLLAVPARISLNRRPYSPPESFSEVHTRVLDSLRARNQRLQILDVSTGSCNSLYKHGWLSLEADYTAIDLSETMLKQGLEMMSAKGVPVDLVLGDAMDLPFQDNSFDVVLSYGAVNGLTDPGKAICEMARVARPGGILLFLDEQMYAQATAVERSYFHRVLSNHNVIHHCPVEDFPESLTDVRVSQVYQFYYICTARKSAAA